VPTVRKCGTTRILALKKYKYPRPSHAEMDSTTPAQPGSHVMSVVVVVQQGQEETVVAQVSSVFTVVQQLNFSEIEYNYLPMDVVCNGVWRRCLW